MTARTPGQRVRKENYDEAVKFIKDHDGIPKHKMISLVARQLSVSTFKAREYVEIYYDTEEEEEEIELKNIDKQLEKDLKLIGKSSKKT